MQKRPKWRFWTTRHSNPPVFPGESPFFWYILLVSRFLSKSPGSKVNVQVIEAHVGFSDTCGNGLINLSFVPKSKSFFERVDSPSVSVILFCSLLSVVLQEIVASMLIPRAHINFHVHTVWWRKREKRGRGWEVCWGMARWKPPCFKTPEIGMSGPPFTKPPNYLLSCNVTVVTGGPSL